MPSQRPMLPQEFLLANRRERVMRGTIEAVAVYGYRDCTVANIVHATKVARNTFYETFDNKADALGAAFDWIIGRATVAVDESDDALEAICAFVQENPLEARVVLVETMCGLPERYDEAVGTIARMIDGLGEDHALGLVGGIAAVLYRRVVAGGSIDADELRPFVEPHLAAA